MSSHNRIRVSCSSPNLSTTLCTWAKQVLSSFARTFWTLHWYESFLTHSLPPIHIHCGVHEGTIWRIAPIRSSRSVESVCIQCNSFWITNHTTCAFTRALFGVCKYLSLRVYACERRANIYIYMRARILCFGVSVCVCVYWWGDTILNLCIGVNDHLTHYNEERRLGDQRGSDTLVVPLITSNDGLSIAF